MIPPGHFVEEMEKHWTGTLGNVSTEGLRKAWKLFAGVLADVTAAYDNPAKDNTFTAIQFPTGTGKTQGTILYFALLARMSSFGLHPGGLIVTRRIKDADGIAMEINRLARKYFPEIPGDTAISYHSENKGKVNIEDLHTFPVLVITHSAYELALEKLGNGGTVPKTWKHFYRYRGIGRRKLVIIDEAIELVEEFQVDIKNLKALPWFFTPEIKEEFPLEVNTVGTVIALLEGRNKPEEKMKEAILSEKPLHKGCSDAFPEIQRGKFPNFTAFREALRKRVEFEKHIPRIFGEQGGTDHKKRERIRKIVDNTIKSLAALFMYWVYYAKDNSIHTLNTARLLVPNDGTVRGAVILDATAGSNRLYELFGERVKVIKAPEGVRSYIPATLHVTRERKTGKGSLTRNAQELTPTLMSALKSELQGQKRSVFIATHKAVEPYLIGYTPEDLGFDRYAVNHFGNTDGSNEWQDFDTAVIFGLPYRPQTWTANVFMAFKGVQSTEWLRSRGKRPFGKHPDIRIAIEEGQLVTDIVQLINRIRCRRVIDTEGNCPTADIYLTLPKGKKGHAILKGILKEMPAITVKEWSYSVHADSKPVKKGKHEEAFISYLQNGMEKGARVTANSIRTLLSIPRMSFSRLLSRIKQGSSEDALNISMLDAGVALEPPHTGKSTYFVKAA
jgi:hypothetical protein